MIQILRIAAGAALTAAGVLINTDRWVLEFAIFLTAYIIAGGDVVLKALRNILRGRVFDEHFLMSAATIGAMVIGEYPEGVAVMLFYQLGELILDRAVDNSRDSIAALMDIRPDSATVKRGGELMRVDPAGVRVGELIVIKPGERIPLDARVTVGTSAVDTSALTGEALPRDVFPGSELLSGCVNQGGLLTAEVVREYGESAVSKILELVENAADKKARAERFITKFARYYTPAVVILAALISLLPPLLISEAVFSDWVYRGLTFLVISCPCALVVSIPLSFFGGIGGASRQGILVKGSNYLEALAKAEIVVFDKTGTLTKGVFEVREILAEGMTEAALLELAAHAESCSNHPISLSIQKAYAKEIDRRRVGDAEEIPGYGVRASVDGRMVCAGNAKLMCDTGIPFREEDRSGTVVHIAADGVYAGYILIADEIKEDARRAVASLKECGVRKTVILTGDAKSAGDEVSSALGLDAAYSELLPGGKVEKLEELMGAGSGTLVFAGDGINDAPVLARADVGIAMGGIGSDAAIEAADVVLMTDEPSKIAAAIRISRRTLGIVKQNIAGSLAVKLAVLILAAAGFASMWAGVAADVGVTVLAVLNAARALNTKSVV